MKAPERKVETKRATARARDEKVDLSMPKPLSQHASVTFATDDELDKKMVICHGTPLRPDEEFLFKILAEEGALVGYRYRPTTEKDTGMKRMYGQSWWCGAGNESDNTHTVTSSPKPAYEADTEILQRSRVLLAFDGLQRRKIPAAVYERFQSLYGRMPRFTVNP